MKTQTTRRKLTPEFKAKVVIEALREQSTLADIAKKYEISQAQLSRWKKEFLANAAAAFGGSGQQQEMKKLTAERAIVAIARLASWRWSWILQSGYPKHWGYRYPQKTSVPGP